MKVAKFTKENFTYRDINERPFPDFESFGIKRMVDDFSYATRTLYRYSRYDARPFVIVTARGCPFHCTFCIKHPSKYRPRSIENIMAEIEENYEKYKFNVLIVSDELFAVNNKRLKEFCTTLISEKERNGWDFDWMFQTHPNARFDYETLELAKKAGCYLFSYGLESASPRVLESMNKKSEISQIIEAIDLARKTGIGFGGNLLFGDPAETEDTIYESLDFLSKYCRDAFVFLSPVMPYPGSTIFNGCIERGIIQDKLKYYEEIDERLFNMTSIPHERWLDYLKFVLALESSWLMVEHTDAISWEEDTGDDPVAKFTNAIIYKIRARCPYCGADIVYKQMLGGRIEGQKRLFLGVGCTKCNKKIRIDIKNDQDN